MRRIIATILVAASATGIIAGSAHAAGTSKWEHYRSRVSGNVIVIKTACEAEDTLAHLRLLEKDAGRIVLGCHHKGY
jgi:hypothetical protein